MDGSENLPEATENLTSTIMGSVLVRNTKDSENIVNDSLPSSSSDANTAATAVITQDDPISSTSEEIVASKKQVFIQQSDSSVDIQMDPETAQIARQLDIGIPKDNSQTNNFEDIASELENLLEESAGDYKFSSKPLRNTTALDTKDLDWDIDCEYSISSKHHKSEQSVCDNDNVVPSSYKASLETPSSSREIVEGVEKAGSKSISDSQNILESIPSRNITENEDTSAFRKDTDSANDEVDNIVSKKQSLIKITTLKTKISESSIEFEPNESMQVNDSTSVLLNDANVEAINESIDSNDSKHIMETVPNNEVHKSKCLEVPQLDLSKNSNILPNKDDDTINGVDSNLHSMSEVIEKDSHIEEETCKSAEDRNNQMEISAPLKLTNNPASCEFISMASSSRTECSAETPKLNQITADYGTLICRSGEQLTFSSDSGPEDSPFLNANNSSPVEAKQSDNVFLQSSALKIGQQQSDCSPITKADSHNLDISTTSVEAVSSEVLVTCSLSPLLGDSTSKLNITFGSATSESSETIPSSVLGMIPDNSEKSSMHVEANVPNVDTTSASGLDTAGAESTDDGSFQSFETTYPLVESDASIGVPAETASSQMEIRMEKSPVSEPIVASLEMDIDNAATFVFEEVNDIGDGDIHDHYIPSTVSTLSVDSCIEPEIAEVTPSDESKSTLPSTETASESSALIFTQASDFPVVEAVIEEYSELSDQPAYEAVVYQNQDLVQHEESYSQEQSFDSYEEQEEDTLESALIKAAVDAEHTRREITANKLKEKEEQQAKLREQADFIRKQREKSRLEAEKARKLLEEEEQRERDLLNRQIEEEQKLKQEKRLAEERLIEGQKLAEEKRLADVKRLADEKKIAEKIKLVEEKKLSDDKIAEEKKLVEEKNLADEKPIHKEKMHLKDEQKRIEDQKLTEKIKFSENIASENTANESQASIPDYRCKDIPVVERKVAAKKDDNVFQDTDLLKPLNIEVENQCELIITKELETTTKDDNNSEQPSESEEDNKPEYSSKMSQESLKMTITKNKNELDNILKVYDPSEEDQTIRKLKIRPVVEESVKIIFKNLHEKIPHSPKRSLRNLSPNRPQSPKVTIKPIKQESPLKITIKNVGRKSDELEPTQQISPKITIKHILNLEEENILGSRAKNILEDDDRLHSPKSYKNESERSSSPKVIIKPVIKSDNNESIPKLNIRLNKREQSPKHSSKNIKNREEENIVEPLKLNIKQYSKDACSISPKITFKSVMRPQETIHESDDGTPERIVLKINKSNYLVDSPQVRKREAPEDIEKLAKIKLKVSKKPGHAHIVNEEMEALKRSLPEGIELVDIKKPKLHIPTHTQGGATITPIVMKESVSQLEELSSDSVIFIGESESTLSSHDELTITPTKVPGHVVMSISTPPPKRRGRPRKVPLEPRDVPIEEPTSVTSSDNLLMITPNPNMSLHDGGHFLLSPTGSTSGGGSPPSELPEQTLSSGRPKRSCRGPSAHTQLGIKPRKPRGAGSRARGGRGRGHRGGLRGGGIDKPAKFELLSEPKLKLLKESALSMKITDAFDRQDIAIRIVDGVQEQCGIPTIGRRRGGGHDNDSDDDGGGTLISGGGGMEIIPRYGTVEEDEPMEMGTIEQMPIKHGTPGKGRIGFLASGVIDITADDSLPPPEDEDDDDEMAAVEEVVSSSSPPPCNLARQLKIVIGRNDQIGEVIMNKDIVIYEEETRMSADIGSRSGTPGKQVSPAVDPLAGIIDMAMPCEDTQSSVQSSATTESAKVTTGTDALTSKAPTRRTFCRSDLSQDIDALVAITSPEQLAEYHWQGDGPFMLQEQIAEYLGVKSFKRKYPHINRRAVDMQERDYIRDNGLASEAMCNLGLTVLNSADVLDIMYSDFQLKYEEYCKHRRDKEAKEIMNRQRAINLAASQEKSKLDLVQTAISSTAQWNARFNRMRREQRPACMDLQTFTINYAKGSRKVISRGSVGHYPLALVPGQFTDYYQAYTPTELNNLPFNTILHTVLSATCEEDDSGSDSDSSGSDSGSDSTSGSSRSSSSSSSDEEDNIAGKGQTSPLNARSPISAPTGKRLQAAA